MLVVGLFRIALSGEQRSQITGNPLGVFGRSRKILREFGKRGRRGQAFDNAKKNGFGPGIKPNLICDSQGRFRRKPNSVRYLAGIDLRTYPMNEIVRGELDLIRTEAHSRTCA